MGQLVGRGAAEVKGNGRGSVRRQGERQEIGPPVNDAGGGSDVSLTDDRLDHSKEKDVSGREKSKVRIAAGVCDTAGEIAADSMVLYTAGPYDAAGDSTANVVSDEVGETEMQTEDFCSVAVLCPGDRVCVTDPGAANEMGLGRQNGLFSNLDGPGLDDWAQKGNGGRLGK